MGSSVAAAGADPRLLDGLFNFSMLELHSHSCGRRGRLRVVIQPVPSRHTAIFGKRPKKTRTSAKTIEKSWNCLPFHPSLTTVAGADSTCTNHTKDQLKMLSIKPVNNGTRTTIVYTSITLPTPRFSDVAKTLLTPMSSLQSKTLLTSTLTTLLNVPPLMLGMIAPSKLATLTPSSSDISSTTLLSTP